MLHSLYALQKLNPLTSCNAPFSFEAFSSSIHRAWKNITARIPKNYSCSTPLMFMLNRKLTFSFHPTNSELLLTHDYKSLYITSLVCKTNCDMILLLAQISNLLPRNTFSLWHEEIGFLLTFLSLSLFFFFSPIFSPLSTPAPTWIQQQEPQMTRCHSLCFPLYVLMYSIFYLPQMKKNQSILIFVFQLQYDAHTVT